MTIMDLSPFYVARARQNLNKYETVKFVESPAETMPFPDASFDALTCVYLFHELPNPIRRKVVAEMFRVLKPNGKLFFVDSAQRGDIHNEEILEGFTVIAHEPYYLDYVKTDLKSLFTEGGFVVEETSNAWVSKSLTLRKPEVATLFDETRVFPFQ
jgi:ubiquinone/menaquinone biosynthesis C-methylase UbiE